MRSELAASQISILCCAHVHESNADLYLPVCVRRHSLIFPEGVLNRHYEKLVQCDPRLKRLVEGTLQMRPNPDFDHTNSMFDSQHQHLPAHQQPIHQNNTHDSLKNQQPYIIPQHMQMRPNPGHTLGGMLSDAKPEIRLMKMQSSDLASPSSGIIFC